MTRRFGASPIAPFRLALGALAGASLALSACSERESVTIDYSGPVAGWSHVGGNLGGQRYSPLPRSTGATWASSKRPGASRAAT